MKLDLSLATDFGAHLADGAAAAEYRMGRIDPYVEICGCIVLDFQGVRSANSSFVNALVSGLIEQHGEVILKKRVFKGCNTVIQVLIQAAIDLGLSKIDGRTIA
jgi:hypothetical protein